MQAVVATSRPCSVSGGALADAVVIPVAHMATAPNPAVNVLLVRISLSLAPVDPARPTSMPSPAQRRPAFAAILDSTFVSTAAVEFADLVQSYGDRRALDGLTFSAPAEAITCVLAQRAGKTTAMEMASGLRRPQSGQVRVLGLTLGSIAGSSARCRCDAAGRRAARRGDPKRFLRHTATLYGTPTSFRP